MFQRKLDEMENQIIDEEIEEDKVDEVEEVDDEGEKVLGKKTPSVLILHYLNKSVPVISIDAIYI